MTQTFTIPSGVRSGLEALIERATDVIDSDYTYWQQLATGQDTEEAEASGFLAGQLAGLQAALELLDYHPDRAIAHLDLELRETTATQPD